MKYPEKRKLTTPEQHLKFVRTFECCRCEKTGSRAWQFSGDAKMSLPLCEICISDYVAGYWKFKSEEEARKIARHLWLISGDVWSATMIILNNRQKAFS